MLNLGAETTENEVEEIISSFHAPIIIDYQKKIYRLSADLLPLIVSFSLGAIASGAFYDALKISLISLVKKFNDKELRRDSIIKINRKTKTYIISKEKIFIQAKDEEITFESIDELLDEIKSDE